MGSLRPWTWLHAGRSGHGGRARTHAGRQDARSFRIGHAPPRRRPDGLHHALGLRRAVRLRPGRRWTEHISPRARSRSWPAMPGALGSTARSVRRRELARRTPSPPWLRKAGGGTPLPRLRRARPEHLSDARAPFHPCNAPFGYPLALGDAQGCADSATCGTSHPSRRCGGRWGWTSMTCCRAEFVRALRDLLRLVPVPGAGHAHARRPHVEQDGVWLVQGWMHLNCGCTGPPRPREREAPTFRYQPTEATGVIVAGGRAAGDRARDRGADRCGRSVVANADVAALSKRALLGVAMSRERFRTLLSLGALTVGRDVVAALGADRRVPVAAAHGVLLGRLRRRVRRHLPAREAPGRPHGVYLRTRPR